MSQALLSMPSGTLSGKEPFQWMQCRCTYIFEESDIASQARKRGVGLPLKVLQTALTCQELWHQMETGCQLMSDISILVSCQSCQGVMQVGSIPADCCQTKSIQNGQ